MGEPRVWGVFEVWFWFYFHRSRLRKEGPSGAEGRPVDCVLRLGADAAVELRDEVVVLLALGCWKAGLSVREMLL